MGGVGGVLHDAVGFAGASCKENVQDGWERGTDDLCSRVHCPLEGLAVSSTAVPVPDSDAAGQHTLNIILYLKTKALHWFESYLTGRSFRVSWGREVSKEHQLVTGFPRGSVLGPLHFTIYTTSLGPIIQAHGFSEHCYADDTQLYHSFQPDNPIVTAWISGCLANISAWMKEHLLQLNLAKTELLVVPATPTLQHDLIILLGSSTIHHILKTARSCRFALHNIRRISPFQTEHAAQLLAQVLVISMLNYCNALSFGLPSCKIKPRQMFQKAVARLIFHEPKRTHFTPLFISLHWLSVAACIKFKTLMFAYRTATGSAPSYFLLTFTNLHPPKKPKICKRCLLVTSQRSIFVHLSPITVINRTPDTLSNSNTNLIPYPTHLT